MRTEAFARGEINETEHFIFPEVPPFAKVQRAQGQRANAYALEPMDFNSESFEHPAYLAIPALREYDFIAGRGPATAVKTDAFQRQQFTLAFYARL